MRSNPGGIVADQQVQALAQSWLIENLSLKDAGWKCTARVVWRVLLLAAARTISIYAACRDLAGAPTDQAIRNALDAWLPKRTRTLEEWFEPVLERLLDRLQARGLRVKTLLLDRQFRTSPVTACLQSPQ